MALEIVYDYSFKGVEQKLTRCYVRVDSITAGLYAGQARFFEITMSYFSSKEKRDATPPEAFKQDKITFRENNAEDKAGYDILNKYVTDVQAVEESDIIEAVYNALKTKDEYKDASLV